MWEFQDNVKTIRQVAGTAHFCPRAGGLGGRYSGGAGEKLRGAALERAAIVEDWRSAAAGGMETALLLWEAAVCPHYSMVRALGWKCQRQQ